MEQLPLLWTISHQLLISPTNVAATMFCKTVFLKPFLLVGPLEDKFRFGMLEFDQKNNTVN